MVVELATAQNAKLRFDPKWTQQMFERDHFLWMNHLVSSSPTQLNAIPRAWCYSDLAFFCKIEVKMEKAVRFPIKFRLGDVQYVDQLEGKRSSY